MTHSFGRISAIVRADFLLRFRRVSTLVVFLALSAFAYVWVPAPSTGRALIQVNDRRAIYNSGAIGMGTASLAMIFVGLFGYYVISNAIRRDITTRCGFVVASTPMSSFEYLLGKFVGNLLFLVSFTGGFMLSSMVMLLMRGEARLDPLIFINQYLLLTSSAIMLVSAVAVLFESVPFLSGKLGDVVYFFLFMLFIGLAVGNEASHGGIPWARALDFTGFGFMIDQSQHTLHTDSIAIGASPFDPTKPPINFPGLSLTRDWVVPRLISLLLPLTLLPLAALMFHRFDPTRIGRATGKAQRKWLGKFQALAKPISRPILRLFLLPARGHSFASAMWTDAVLTISLAPLASVALLAMNVVALLVPLASALPIVFVVLGIVIADLSTRDARAGTVASLYATPRLRENLIWWKLGSTFLLSLLFGAAALGKAFVIDPARVPSILVGLIFVTAAATLCGVGTANAKTFIVGFLTFWYLVVNDHGASPLLHFGGFYLPTSARTLMVYAAISFACIIVALVIQRARLLRQ